MTSLPNRANETPPIVGVDVAKTTSEVSVSDRDATLPPTNNEAGLKALDRELARLDKDLQAFMGEHHAELAALLYKVKGAGKATINTLLAEVPWLGQLSGRKAGALVGVAPVKRDAGTMRRKRSIFGGRAHVRKVLFIAALLASRRNPVIKPFYQRLLAVGNTKKLALTACARILMAILNAMIRTRNPFNAALHLA